MESFVIGSVEGADYNALLGRLLLHAPYFSIRAILPGTPARNFDIWYWEAEEGQVLTWYA